MNASIVAAATVVALSSATAHAGEPHGATGRTRTECASLFMALDGDHDGRISRQEASADPAIASAFEELHLDEFGYMTVYEFMTACQKPDSHLDQR